MAKQKLYPYDTYSNKDQDRHPGNKTLMEKVFPARGISVKDNGNPMPVSTAKTDRQNSPDSPMRTYNNAERAQRNFFSAKRLKKL